MYKKHRMTKIMRCRWDRLLLLSKAVLGAVFQALDVRAEQPDDHSGHDDAANRAEHDGGQVGPTGNQVDKSAHRIQRSNDDAAQRDDAGDGNFNQEDNGIL